MITNLMIGDWVQNPLGYKAQVKNIRWIPKDKCANYGGYYLIDIVRGEGYLAKLDEKDVEPILISTELLEQNGFKKYNFQDIDGQHQWSWWRDTLTSVSLWCRELKDDPKDGWMIRIVSTFASCCCKIENIHEMQQILRICKINKQIEL